MSKLALLPHFTLTPMSWLYRFAVRIRHYLYDKKCLTKKFAPLPVVSIGNVVAGGAGKTQVALFLAEQLSDKARIAILSRGYLGDAEHAKHPLVVDIKKHSAKACGDEPWLLAERLKKAWIIVNKNRFKSSLRAKQLGADLLVLDDGMQHRKLHRDFEIVVIDGNHPLNGGTFLPKGNLREELSQLKRADLLFFMGKPQQELQTTLSSYTLAPSVVASVRVSEIKQLDGTPIDSLKGLSVGLFCGIGNPQRFVKTIEELGSNVVESHFSSDHKLMKPKDLLAFATRAKAKGAKWLLCTEKDKVKLSKQPKGFPLPIAWVRTKLEIIENQKVWDKTVADIKQLARISL